MWPQKARCNVRAASASTTRSVNADTQNGASLMEASTSPVAPLPRGNRLIPVAVGENTQRTTMAI